MAENRTANHNWELIRGDEPLDLRLANRAIRDIDESLRGIVVNMIYPIGSIYCNATDNRNPNAILGFGTWEAYAHGRVLVGNGTSDQAFRASENIEISQGGASTHTLTCGQIPAHDHPVLTSNGALGNGAFSYPQQFGASRHGTAFGMRTSQNGQPMVWDGPGGYPTGQPHDNLQPYQVVYMWRRTA